MFTSQDEVKWCATRYKFARTWRKGGFVHNTALAYISMSNYTAVLVAGFSHLFNVRLKQRGGCL